MLSSSGLKTRFFSGDGFKSSIFCFSGFGLFNSDRFKPRFFSRSGLLFCFGCKTKAFYFFKSCLLSDLSFFLLLFCSLCLLLSCLLLFLLSCLLSRCLHRSCLCRSFCFFLYSLLLSRGFSSSCFGESLDSLFFCSLSLLLS